MRDINDDFENRSKSVYLKIMRYIEENPGCYLRKIKKDLNLSMGTIQYYLNKLEYDGKISSQRNGLHKHYFAIGVFNDDEKDLIKFLTQETPREILLFIVENGAPTQTEIVNKIMISPSSINWHLKRLIQAHLLDEIRDGKFKRYSLSSKTSSLKIAKLLRHYHPSIWDRWSNRLAEMFLSLSSIEETKKSNNRS